MEGDAADQQGLNSGTVVGGSFAAGQVGQAYLPQNSRIDVPDSATLELAAFSITGWVRLDSVNSKNMAIVYKGDAFGSSASGPYSVVIDKNAPTLSLHLGNGVSFAIFTSTGQFPLGVWTHFGVTCDATSVGLYFNGKLDSSFAHNFGPLVDNAFPLTLGGVSDNAPANSVRGAIDEIRLHGTVLTEEQILMLYAGEGGALGPPVIYCVAKPSSAGCVAAMSTSSASAQPVSGANDYSALAASVQGQKNGILFFGNSGATSLPFLGGTLCALPPLGRTPIQASGGSGPLACDGSFSQIINDGGVTHPSLDCGPGTSNWLQWWYRDPLNGAGTLGTALSDAVMVTFSL